MTDATIGDERALLRETTRTFLAEQSPIARVRELAETAEGFDRALWEKGNELGWLSIALPEEHGGLGRGLIDLAGVAEEMGRALYPGPFMPSAVAAMAIAEDGTDAQRETFLPAIAGGRTIPAWCVAEASGIWDPAAVEATAARAGEEFVLRGTKHYVQDAHVADLLVVAARLDGRIAQFLVPSRAPGITVLPQQTLDLTRSLCTVELDDVRVPAEARLGRNGGGTDPMDRQVQVAITLQCAESVGGAARLLEMATAHARERVQFGRPIGSFQAIKHRCADMLVSLEAATAAAGYAAVAVEQRSGEAAVAASVAKAFVGEAYTRIAHGALQVHGGMGFTWEHDVHLYLRRAKSSEVLLGSPRWHRERVFRLATQAER